jgi:hypothetical protein
MKVPKPSDVPDVLTLKTRTFGGVHREMDEADLPVSPECVTYKGMNYWIENGNLMCRNNYASVLPQTVTVNMNDGYTYKIKSMCCGILGISTPYLLLGVEAYSGATLSHYAILRSSNFSTFTTIYWDSTFAGSSLNAKLQSANFKSINYERVPYGYETTSTIAREGVILTNGIDPVLFCYLGYKIFPLKSAGWNAITVVPATDVFTCAALAVDDNEIEFYSLTNNYPGGIEYGVTYYVANASGSTFKVTDGADVIDITTAGSDLMARLISNRATDAPRGTEIMLHSERVWIGGFIGGAVDIWKTDATYFSDKYHDDISHAHDWSTVGAAGHINLPTWDGDSINGLFNFEGDPLAIKKNSVFRITGEDIGTYEANQLFNANGTIAPKSFCRWREFRFYATHEGIQVFNGVSTDSFLINEIKDIWYPDPNLICNVVGDVLFIYGQMYDALTGVLGNRMLAVDLNTKNICPWDMLSPVLSVNNLTTYGNFPDLTGWSTITATVSASSNELIITATSSGGGVARNITVVSGRKYYIRIDMKSTSVLFALHLWEGAVAVANLYADGTGTYAACSCVYTATSAAEQIRIGDDRWSGWTECRAKYLLMIDLTEAFGAGNEPTAAEMDAMLLAYAPTTSWFSASALLDVSANPAPLQVDATLDPWFTTLKTGVTKPELWFVRNDMIYKYSNTFPTSGAPHMVFYTPSHDYGTSVRKKRVTTMKLTGSGGTVSVTPIQDGVEKTAKSIELPATRPSPFNVNGYQIGFKIENVGGDPLVIRDKEETYL